MAETQLLSDRRRESEARLIVLRADLEKSIGAVEKKFDEPELCIYATGSLARLEANSHSDLDAFFLLSGNASENPIGKIRETKILNAVIFASEENGFPDFSNDGEYLRFLHIDDVIRHIGGREDDYHNAFTARMLLILESKFLYNNQVYIKFRNKIINAYFKDFHDHSKAFQPIFLLNDILRFWRTMCLNYENARKWRGETPEKSAKGHLANLKLRFSRLSICFSFIDYLLSRGPSLAPHDVIATAELTPVERFAQLQLAYPNLGREFEQLLDEYDWFLGKVGFTKDNVLSWISREDVRFDAFDHSRKFAELMEKIVREVADSKGYLRYLII